MTDQLSHPGLPLFRCALRSMAKALLMACIGVVLGLLGLDSITAQPQLTFGRIELIDGIGLVPVVMGLFGVAEVLLNTEQAIKRDIIKIGYCMRKLGYEPAPLVLAFVPGPMLENNLRKSLILSQGDLMTFVERPISAVCLAFAVVLLIGPLLPSLRRKRELVALDEGA